MIVNHNLTISKSKPYVFLSKESLEVFLKKMINALILLLLLVVVLLQRSAKKLYAAFFFFFFTHVAGSPLDTQR